MWLTVRACAGKWALGLYHLQCDSREAAGTGLKIGEKVTKMRLKKYI
jgi:hypothetical protein